MSCSACKQKATDEYLDFGEERVHAKCFVCHTCKISLAEQQFFKSPDGKSQFYCSPHYYEKFSQSCAHCGEVITGAFLKALNQYWCENHFVCSTCGEPFKGDKFKHRDGKPYCELHYVGDNQCSKCLKPLTDPTAVESLGQRFHNECFTCAEGGHQLHASKPFHLVEQKLFCEAHFSDRFSATCSLCTKKISGPYYDLGSGTLVHPLCWTCKKCHKKLTLDPQEGYRKHSEANGWYCVACSEKTDEGKSIGARVRQQLKEYALQSRLGKTRKPPDEYVVKEFYTLDVLRNRSKCEELGVHPGMKELHLSDRDFVNAFGMSRNDFFRQAKWKRNDAKKRLGLF
eukprot:g42261.t1